MRNDEASEGEGAATPGGGSDVIREPDNSVVNDWLGQRVARDEDRAEEALTEAGGDEQEAERIFDAASHEGDEYRSQHTQTIRDDRMSSDDRRRYLRIYVADHSAAAAAGVALTRRCLRSNEGTALGDVLRELLSQIEEDATTLAAMRTELNLKDAPLKRAVALVGERLARVKFNGRLIRYSPLSRLIEIEAILTGIDAKRSLWLALQQHAHAAALDRFDLSELVGRAEKQRSALRPHHLDAAAAAFG